MKKLIIANWKMNPQTLKEAQTILKTISNESKKYKNAHVVMCPPYPYLFLAKNTKLKKGMLGAQNISHELSGAYTGQVSSDILKSIGVDYVIIGHSENRSSGDTNILVNQKIILALKSKLLPILCVGELIRDSHGGYLTFIKNQVTICLASVPKAQMKNIVIAYEPLWAIGAHAVREATHEEFTEVKIFIRKIISDMYGPVIAHMIPVLYGGSVHPENTREFIIEGGADGLLVGRDSLNPKKFDAILAAAH